MNFNIASDVNRVITAGLPWYMLVSVPQCELRASVVKTFRQPIPPPRHRVFHRGTEQGLRPKSQKEKGAPATALPLGITCDCGSQSHGHDHVPVIVLFLSHRSELCL